MLLLLLPLVVSAQTQTRSAPQQILGLEQTTFTIVAAAAGAMVILVIVSMLMCCRSNRGTRCRRSTQSKIKPQNQLSAKSSTQVTKSESFSEEPASQSQSIQGSAFFDPADIQEPLYDAPMDYAYIGTVYDQTMIEPFETSLATMYDARIEGPLTIPGFLELDMEKDVETHKLLSQGGFGEVFTGLLINPVIRKKFGDVITKVAIKMIKPPASISEEENRIVFDQEVALMWHFDRHPNFIQLVGYSHQPLATVTKLYEFGSLSNLIYGKQQLPNTKYNFYLVLQLGANIASALAELHTRQIAHNDIKPDNVLIDLDYLKRPIGVLCDFSISSVHSEELLGVKAFRKSQLEGASIHYCPPELLLDPSTMDPNRPKTPLAVDVYSLGLVLFEMAARKHPWHKMPQQDIINAVCDGLRPHIPSAIVKMAGQNEQTSFLLEIIARCWAQDPLQRPTIQEIVGKLNGINNKLRAKAAKAAKTATKANTSSPPQSKLKTATKLTRNQ